MFYSIKKTAVILEIESHQVYYLLNIFAIEAIKIGKVWRVVPESVVAYKAKSAA